MRHTIGFTQEEINVLSIVLEELDAPLRPLDVGQARREERVLWQKGQTHRLMPCIDRTRWAPVSLPSLSTIVSMPSRAALRSSLIGRPHARHPRRGMASEQKGRTTMTRFIFACLALAACACSSAGNQPSQSPGCQVIDPLLCSDHFDGGPPPSGYGGDASFACAFDAHVPLAHCIAGDPVSSTEQVVCCRP
jgi:hypothetical protein